MDYSFDINNLEIINHLIYDSAMNPADVKLADNGTVELMLERKAFEDVERKKFLFWNKTFWKGRRSLLQLHGVKKIRILHTDEQFKDDNHFIDGLMYDPIMEIVELITAFGMTVEMEITDQFRCSLVDAGPSESGNGSSIGKVSFTTEEWKAYLQEMEYVTGQL
jgi:hypothetical protein